MCLPPLAVAIGAAAASGISTIASAKKQAKGLRRVEAAQEQARREEVAERRKAFAAGQAGPPDPISMMRDVEKRFRSGLSSTTLGGAAGAGAGAVLGRSRLLGG